MPLISIENACRTYAQGSASVVALRDISLEIERGEFIAIWGPSGSGKSTLCNLVGAIDLPSEGLIKIDGVDMARLTDDQLSEYRNRSIGFIFQSFNLVKVLTALENVMLPLKLRGVTDSSCRQQATVILNEIGLGGHLSHRPDQLSGGQQQRVAIARALVVSPELVIADEPTANLDSETARDIIVLMRHYNRTLGTTFIFSTHDQRLIEEVGRRIHLKDGRIIEDLRVETRPAAIATGAAAC